MPLKTLQNWMGHSDADMILSIYTKLDKEQEKIDAAKLKNFLDETDHRQKIAEGDEATA